MKNRSSGETGVESTELDPTVLIEHGSIAAAVFSTWKSERKKQLLTVFFFFFYYFLFFVNCCLTESSNRHPNCTDVHAS